MSNNNLKHWYSKFVNDKLVCNYIKDEDIIRDFACAELVGMQGRIQMASVLSKLPIAGQGPRWKVEE